MCSVMKKYCTVFKVFLVSICPCEMPSLRTVSFVIGGLNVFLSALFTIRVLVHLAIYNHVEPKIVDRSEVETEELKLGFATLLIMLTIGVAWFLSSLLLIKGIYQDRFKLMSWWIYLNYFAMAIIFGTAFVAFIADCIYWTSFGEVFGKLLLYIIGSGTSFLVFYPVFLLYKKLKINTETQTLRDNEISKPTTPDTRVKDFYESEKPQKNQEYDLYESEKQKENQEFE